MGSIVCLQPAFIAFGGIFLVDIWVAGYENSKGCVHCSVICQRYTFYYINTCILCVLYSRFFSVRNRFLMTFNAKIIEEKKTTQKQR